VNVVGDVVGKQGRKRRVFGLLWFRVMGSRDVLDFHTA
jgi:hypothetical protein